MSEDAADYGADELPVATLAPNRGLSLFWLIPLVAAAVAGWLAWDHYRQRGPEITITFQRGEGIEAGKTTVRFKAVEIGQVIGVSIAPDLKSIEVRARINLEFADHLRGNTRFWVVRPRIGAQGISGLGTLVSGAYIEIEPADGPPARHFDGLNIPPIVASDVPGRRFILRARQLGNVQPGSIVSFKDIEVGEILGHELAADGETVIVHAFVREPYSDLVRENSRFWLASGLNLSVGPDGLDFTTPSLQEVLVGGIKFDSPAGLAAPPAAAGSTFQLFETFNSIAEAGITEQVPHVLYFDESVRGLTIGAPVEFRGIKLGEVAEIGLEIDPDKLALEIPVIANLHPQRLGYKPHDGKSDSSAIISSLVARGLRARLQTGNLLTGRLYIELTLEPDAPARYVTGKHNLPQIPTLPTEFGEFKQNANALLADFRRFPLAAIGTRAVAALAAIERRLSDPELDQAIRAAGASFTSIGELASSTQADFAALRQDLSAALGALKDGSPLQIRLHETLRQVDATARSLRQLADELERQPQAVIWGKEATDE